MKIEGKLDKYNLSLDFDEEILKSISVDGKSYLCSPNIQEIDMFTLTPYFLRADVTTGIPKKIIWRITNKTTNTIREFEAFNYCFFPETPGKYEITYGINVININVTKNTKITYVKTLQELITACNKSKATELISIQNDIEFKDQLKFKGTLISKTGKEKLIYTGAQLDSSNKGKKLIYLLDGACCHSITITNKTYDENSREKTGNIFYCQGNNVINRIKASGMRCFTNLENRPNNVYVANCTIWENTLWDYFVWFSGEGITIENNKVENSRREHIIRGNNYRFVSIIENNFQNLDRRPEDEDIAKGCIVCQWGEYIYCYKNTVTFGGLGIGPLGRNDGKQYPDSRVKFAVARKNICNQVQLQLLHGLEYFLCEDNTAKIWCENTEIGYPAERTFKYGIIKGDVQNAPKNTVEVQVN